MFPFCVDCKDLNQVISQFCGCGSEVRLKGNATVRKITSADHDAIIQAFHKGHDVKTVQKKFRGKYSVAQIAAKRAWVTMGKYSKSSKVSKASKTSKSCHISQSDHNDILRAFYAGHNVKSVQAKFRKYSVPQIAAVKAWITMGKY